MILDVSTTCSYALGLIVARVSQVWIQKPAAHLSWPLIYTCENIGKRNSQEFCGIRFKSDSCFNVLALIICVLDCLFRCMLFSLTISPVISILLPRISICFEIACHEGWWGKGKGEMACLGWSWACGKLGEVWEVCFQFEPCSVMQKKGSEHLFHSHTCCYVCLPLFVAAMFTKGEMGFAYTEIYLVKILWTCSFKTITHLCSWTVNLNLKPKKPGLFPFSMATSVSLPQPNSSLTKLSSLIIWIISHANWFVF